MQTLDYATPAILKPPSNALRLTALWMNGIAAVGGVGILSLFLITAWEPLPMAGFFWLGGGGVLTAIALVLGIIYTAVGRSRKFPAPSSSQRAAMLITWPFLNCLLAAGCFFGGIGLMNWHARRVIITNEGTQPIDKIELTSPGFQKTIETLGPGKTKSIHFPRQPTQTMKMRVHIGGDSVPYTVMEQMDADGMFGPRYVKLNGLTGYKNRQGSPP